MAEPEPDRPDHPDPSGHSPTLYLDLWNLLLILAGVTVVLLVMGR
jgi:hypothetical protein